jgi:cytochrome c biogenesis protein CcmG/thiol:disulfide interchange protein DsbE
VRTLLVLLAALFALSLSPHAWGQKPTSQKTDGGKSLAAEFLEGTAAQRVRLAGLEGSDKLPKLTLKDWTNAKGYSWEDLKGKVVVLVFWATWCGPCIRSIPHTNALADKYKGKVVFIGVCHPRGGEKMKDVVKEHGIKYPVALDAEGKLIGELKVNSYPDYYVIDAKGVIRGADVVNSKVEALVQLLLEEQ